MLKKLITIVAVSLASMSANAALLTFDSAPGAYTDMVTYTEGGYQFTLSLGSGGFNQHFGDGAGGAGTLNWHDDGDNGVGALVTMTQIAGGLFSITSLDLIGGMLHTSLLNVSSVTFTARSINFGGSGIDNVNVTSVPEPASLALLGLGLAGVAVARKRQAK